MTNQNIGSTKHNFLSISGNKNPFKYNNSSNLDIGVIADLLGVGVLGLGVLGDKLAEL